VAVARGFLASGNRPSAKLPRQGLWTVQRLRSGALGARTIARRGYRHWGSLSPSPTGSPRLGAGAQSNGFDNGTEHPTVFHSDQTRTPCFSSPRSQRHRLSSYRPQPMNGQSRHKTRRHAVQQLTSTEPGRPGPGNPVWPGHTTDGKAAGFTQTGQTGLAQEPCVCFAGFDLIAEKGKRSNKPISPPHGQTAPRPAGSPANQEPRRDRMPCRVRKSKSFWHEQQPHEAVVVIHLGEGTKNPIAQTR